MNIYRLDPIAPEHPSWALSAEMETLWTAAPTSRQARDLAAEKTWRGPPGGAGGTPQSPWQLAGVTSCVLEPTMAHIHPGTVIRADGSRVDDTC
ncbi:hypothetical protein GALL_253090 [mine drainage metagenome]|uniref:Uncharacterized protein n=1 Tax=mine drainage metagenome TaxID=410659 RepID=A0A1J5RT97_9ZZZZ